MKHERGARTAHRKQSSSSQSARYIFGRHAAAEALAARVPLKKAFVSASHDERLDHIVHKLHEKGIPTEELSTKELEIKAKNPAHQGILLEAAPYSYADFADILKGCKQDKNTLVLVLDHLEDEGNVGAIARVAEVVGAAGLILPRARSASVGAGAYKASAGAVAYLPIAQVGNLAQTLSKLKEEGFWVVGATEHARENVWEAPLSGRIALVVGSEKEGISRLLQKECDYLAKLPQTGHIESLNVAQATTVFAYEWLRQSLLQGH